MESQSYQTVPGAQFIPSTPGQGQQQTAGFRTDRNPSPDKALPRTPSTNSAHSAYTAASRTSLTPSSHTTPGPPMSHAAGQGQAQGLLDPGTPTRHGATAGNVMNSSRAPVGPINDNPFGVDLVIPFDVALKSGDRQEAQRDAQAGYARLIQALQSQQGLRIASHPGRGGKGNEEIWVFVGASDSFIDELLEREQVTDRAHGLVTPDAPVTPATRLRLLHDFLVTPPLQHGLGITPGEAPWERVKSIVALHDDARDDAWVKRWSVGGDWKVGLLQGLGDENSDILSRNQPPAVRLYFNYLSTYTMSLMPLAFISTMFWFFSPVDSYPPLYALVLAIYSSVFLAVWKIRERKLAVQWGMRGCENVAVGGLRPQYVRAHNVRSIEEPHTKSDVVRDSKVIFSIPVILACGAALGVVLMTIFMIEAFVGQLWHGPGKAVVPFIPMALFSGVVPQVVMLFGKVAQSLVHWEDHPTSYAAKHSLTAKTFALNATVAYLGLYLSAYLYLPFGPYVMSYVQKLLIRYHGPGAVKTNTKASIATTKASLAAAEPAAFRSKLNASRLKSQVFAYTVTNQVINTFLEIGLPFILRYVNDVRTGKASVGSILKKDKDEKPLTGDVESRFLDKVQGELNLPEYNIFTDYAEMVTQFGYVVIWSIVWPLAPLFALINNYFELRSDALKISKHVRRPIGGRVETIGTWLDALGIIGWMGAWTSATLIELFRPKVTLGTQRTVATFLASHDAHPTFQSLVPTLVPIAFYALAASHGYFILRAIVTALAERLLWRGSPEQVQEQINRGALSSRAAEQNIQRIHQQAEKTDSHSFNDNHSFWNGAEEGSREIARLLKAE